MGTIFSIIAVAIGVWYLVLVHKSGELNILEDKKLKDLTFNDLGKVLFVGVIAVAVVLAIISFF